MTTRKKTNPEQEPANKASMTVAEVKTEGLKIFAMEVENIKRVSFARIRPKSDVVIISGNNGSGKSSILDSIEWAITGTSHIPSQPIRKGQRTAHVKIDLGEFRLTRQFTRVDPTKSAEGNTFFTKLILEGKNGEVYRTPQSLLDSFMGKISFDPLEFIRMEPRKQLETLRGMVKFDVDVDALEQEKKQAYDLRRDAGRDVDQAKARLAALPAPPEGLPEQLVDVEAIAKKLSEAANHNSVIAAEKQEQARKREQARGAIADTQRVLDEVRQLEARIKTLHETIEVTRMVAARLEKEAEAMTFAEPIDTAAVTHELTNAQSINGAIQRRTTYRAIEKQLADAEAQWADLDATVKQKEAERAAAIERAQMPIPGLSIGDGEVLFTDIPFSQASNAEQIRVSTALAMATNPKLRVLRIKDGSLLDDKSLQLIATMATEANYQVWVERVGTGGKVAVVMEDGEASGDAVEVVPAAAGRSQR